MRLARLQSRLLKLAAFAGVSLGGLSAAKADYTTLYPSNGNEPTISQILDHTYGGSFAQSGLNFSNASGITLTRVEDSKPTGNLIMDLAQGQPGYAADQVWNGATFSASVKAAFSWLPQSFGYIDGASGGSYTNLFNVTGSGYDVQGSVSNINLTNHYLRFARGVENGIDSSLNSDNADVAYALDHMVSFRVTGLNDGTNTWLMMFEDLNVYNNLPGLSSSDRDFNDLVVEVKANKTCGCHAVPLPASAWMSLTTLGGAFAVGGVRKLRRLV